jgi:hypothetical protein
MRCMNGCYCISELNTCQRNAVRTELMNPRSELDQECFGFFPGWRQVQWVGPCFYFSFILWSSPCADYKRKENRIQHGQAAHCEVTSTLIFCVFGIRIDPSVRRTHGKSVVHQKAESQFWPLKVQIDNSQMRTLAHTLALKSTLINTPQK